MTAGACARFDAALKRHLDARGYRFYSLRTRRRRIAEAVRLLLSHAGVEAGVFLNIGSGPFVLEFLLESQRPWQFLSIDLESHYVPLYRELCREGLLTRTTFLLADIRQSAFPPGAFSGVVAHDLLFTPSLNLDTLLPDFARWVKPGGVLCMDVWDAGAKGLWQAVGRDYGHRRYDRTRLISRLNDEGLRLVAAAPYLGNDQPVRLLRRLLWTTCRISNAWYLLAKKQVGHAAARAEIAAVRPD